MEYLLQLKDGYLLDIESDEESYDGCPTCNYNSEYINTITLICSKYTHTPFQFLKCIVLPYL